MYVYTYIRIYTFSTNGYVPLHNSFISLFAAFGKSITFNALQS